MAKKEKEYAVIRVRAETKAKLDILSEVLGRSILDITNDGVSRLQLAILRNVIAYNESLEDKYKHVIDQLYDLTTNPFVIAIEREEANSRTNKLFINLIKEARLMRERDNYTCSKCGDFLVQPHGKCLNCQK